MRKVLKIMIILIIIIILGFSGFVKASYQSPIRNPNSFKPTTVEGVESINNRTVIIVGIVRAIGTIVSVVALIIIGIKYMIGSVEERAEYKKTMLAYAIGAVLVFAMTALPSAIYNAVNKAETVEKKQSTTKKDTEIITQK